MLDTIQFKIHDLEAHITLARFLNKEIEGVGKSFKMSANELESDNFTVQQKLNFKRFVHFHDRNNLLQVKYFHELASSHYTMLYHIDYLQDCIMFNLSLPKYYNGHNIKQFIPHIYDKEYNYNKTLSDAVNDSFTMLSKFFKEFFDTHFGSIEVYWNKVEISRIDFCFNQIFPTRENAIDYLSEQKRFKKKHLFDSSDSMASWASSISFKSRSHSFKIYHKGTEFYKNDRKQLLKHNKTAKKKINVNKLQDIADRTLRYEATFRKLYISNLYKRTIFRNECPLWHDLLKMFNQYKNFDGLIYNEEKIPYHQLPIRKKKQINYTKNIMNKTFSFFLRSYSNFSLLTDEFVNEIHSQKFTFDEKQVYNRDLHNLLGSRFLEFIDQFKITTKSTLNNDIINILQSEKEINETRKSLSKITGKKFKNSVSVATLKQFFTLLNMHTMDEIKELGYFSRSVFYRIKSILKEYGIQNTADLNFKTIENFNFKEYYNIFK